MPIPDPVEEAIRAYRESNLNSGLRKDSHLLQIPGRDGELHRMVPTRVSDMVCQLGKRAGIRMTTHSLRRFYATTLYHDVECDLQTMKNLMRHADAATTLKCYVNADTRKEMEACGKLVEVIDELRK